MQHQGVLRSPLWNVIKSIGAVEAAPSAIRQHGRSCQDDAITIHTTSGSISRRSGGLIPHASCQRCAVDRSSLYRSIKLRCGSSRGHVSYARRRAVCHSPCHGPLFEDGSERSTRGYATESLDARKMVEDEGKAPNTAEQELDASMRIHERQPRHPELGSEAKSEIPAAAVVKELESNSSSSTNASSSFSERFAKAKARAKLLTNLAPESTLVETSDTTDQGSDASVQDKELKPQKLETGSEAHRGAPTPVLNDTPSSSSHRFTEAKARAQSQSQVHAQAPIHVSSETTSNNKPGRARTHKHPHQAARSDGGGEDDDRSHVPIMTSKSDSPLVSDTDQTDPPRPLIRYPLVQPKENPVDKSDRNVFEQVIQEAADKPRNSRESRTIARIRDGEDFHPRYYYAYQWLEKNNQRNKLQRFQNQANVKYPSSDDWRSLLDFLDEQTPATRELFLRRRETVRLPKGAYARFKGNRGTAILEIHQRTNSHVQVIEPTRHRDADSLGFTAVSLFGSKQDNDRALALLPEYVDTLSLGGMRTRRDLTHQELQSSGRFAYGSSMPAGSGREETSMPKEDEDLSAFDVEELEAALDDITGEADLPVRAVWAEDRIRTRDTMLDLSRNLKNKSASSIAEYVSNLTRPVPRLVARKLYATIPHSSVGHVRITTARLVSLFQDPEVVANVPSSTVTKAIQFLVRHLKFPAFKEIYSCLQDGGYFFDAYNFNACLAAAAKSGDIETFRLTLRVMCQQQHIKPTPETWALFHELMCQRFPLEAGIVLEAIRKRGFLLDNHTAQHVAKNMVGIDLTSHLALGGNVASFLRLYDNRFGTLLGRSDFNWLTRDVAKPTIKPLLAVGKVNEALGILRELRRRTNGSLSVDTGLMNIFLTSALRQQSPESAIAFLRVFRIGEPGALTLDEVAYSILFMIAWRRRYWNMLRVIWRYACAAGHVAPTYMRHRLWKSLLAFKPDKFNSEGMLSRGDLWVSWAGKFAVGVATGLSRYKSRTRPTRPLESTGHNVHGEISGFAQLPQYAHDEFTTEEARTERYEKLKHLRDSDLDEVTQCAPVEPFTDLLEKAWRLDLEWKAEGLGLPKGYREKEDMFREMMDRGIEVPMTAGDFSKAVTQWEVPQLLNRARASRAT